jgi:hypothetical protein
VLVKNKTEGVMCNFLSGVVEYVPSEDRIILHTTPGHTHHEIIVSRNHLNDKNGLLVRVEYVYYRGNAGYTYTVRNKPDWWTNSIELDIKSQLAHLHETLSHQKALYENIYRNVKSDKTEIVRQNVISCIMDGLPIPPLPAKYKTLIETTISQYRGIGRRMRGHTGYKSIDMRSKKLLNALGNYNSTVVVTHTTAPEGWQISGTENREWDEQTGYQRRHGYSASSRRIGYTIYVIRTKNGITRKIKAFAVTEYTHPTAIKKTEEQARKWAARYAMTI